MKDIIGDALTFAVRSNEVRFQRILPRNNCPQIPGPLGRNGEDRICLDQRRDVTNVRIVCKHRY